jgi:hypothetical protein
MIQIFGIDISIHFFMTCIIYIHQIIGLKTSNCKNRVLIINADPHQSFPTTKAFSMLQFENL